MFVAINTYGNHKLGMGHLYRQKALAQELKKRGLVPVFLVKDFKETIDVVKAFNFDFVPYSKKFNTKEELEFIISKIDRYGFEAMIYDFLDTSSIITKALKKRGIKQITFDDRGSGSAYVDLCFSVLFPPRFRSGTTKYISGLDYLVLAPSFSYSDTKKVINKRDVGRIFISQGGSDTYGILPLIIKSLATLPKRIKFDLLVGQGFKNTREFNLSLKNTKGNFSVYRNVESVSTLMKKAGLAVSAAGITAFELISLGIPTVIVTAEPIEKKIAEYLGRENMVVNLGFVKKAGFQKKFDEKLEGEVRLLISDYKARERLFDNCFKKFKNGGVNRVADEILKLTDAQSLN